MRIEFLYFEGCPNAAATRENLKEALEAEFRAETDTVDVTDVLVEPGRNPSKMPFLGSPSVYVDGVDLVTGRVPEEDQFSCRTFTFDNERTGTIPVPYIRRCLRELTANRTP